MADKRMFSKQIIDSDAFLDMPLSAQALYFHLSMRADDDGFIDSPRKIQKMVNASTDDFKLLLAKRYILSFESGVIVIKHWRIHNTIRADRYKETVYQEEKQMLSVKDNKSYTEKDKIVIGIPIGNQMETQYRLDKNSIGYTPLTPQGEAEQSESLKVEKAKGTAKAVNHSKTSVQIRFQSFWEAYPKKKAKGDALKAFNKLNPDDGLMEKMLSALEWQKKSFDWTKDGGQYIPLPASWIRGMRWEDEPEAAVKKEGRKWKILD